MSPFLLGLLFGAAFSTAIACAIAWGIVWLLHRFGGPMAVRIGGGLLTAVVAVGLVAAIWFLIQILSVSNDADVAIAANLALAQTMLNIGTFCLLLVTLILTMRRYWSRPRPARTPREG